MILKDKFEKIGLRHVRESGFLWSFVQRGIQNPGLWRLEYSERNLESHQRLEFRMHVPRSPWVPMTKTGIQGVESSPRFLNMGPNDCRYWNRATSLHCQTSVGAITSRPRRERQTPLINAHSRTLKVYRDYSTHSIF